MGVTDCFGRRGVTAIRITDNDRKLHNNVEQCVQLSAIVIHLTAMIIGFTTRTVCVPENNPAPGFDVWLLPTEVATVRTAEREHPMNFRLQVSSKTAIVEPIGAVANPLYDATFGTRDNINDPIEVYFVLEALQDTIPPLTTFIRDDRRPENEKECFTIRIFPVDVPGRRELFDCNEDDSGADNYFCKTEICIMDNDGRFLTFYNIANGHFYNSIFRSLCCRICGDNLHS